MTYKGPTNPELYVFPRIIFAVIQCPDLIFSFENQLRLKEISKLPKQSISNSFTPCFFLGLLRISLPSLFNSGTLGKEPSFQIYFLPGAGKLYLYKKKVTYQVGRIKTFSKKINRSAVDSFIVKGEGRTKNRVEVDADCHVRGGNCKLSLNVAACAFLFRALEM